MTEEEKKAIEYLKNNHIPVLRYDNYGNILEPLYYGIEEKETLLNLIEKLQKEIEELRKLAEFQKGYRKKLEQDLFENCSNFVVSKDKIREKLNQDYEEYTNLMKAQQSVETKNIWTYQHNAIRGILEELLEEE